MIRRSFLKSVASFAAAALTPAGALAAGEPGTIPFRVMRRLAIYGAEDRSYAESYAARSPVWASVLHRPDTDEFAVLERDAGLWSNLVRAIHDEIHDLIRIRIDHNHTRPPQAAIDPARVQALVWFSTEEEAVEHAGGEYSAGYVVLGKPWEPGPIGQVFPTRDSKELKTWIAAVRQWGGQ